MITGAHAIIFSSDAHADRAFFKDVLGLGSVDAGGGWLIFALPPAELVGGGKPSLPDKVRLKLELLDERRFGWRGSPPLPNGGVRRWRCVAVSVMTRGARKVGPAVDLRRVRRTTADSTTENNLSPSGPR